MAKDIYKHQTKEETRKRWKQIVELKEQRMTHKKIAEAVGMSVYTIDNFFYLRPDLNYRKA